MAEASSIVADREGYLDVRAHVSRVFNSDARLPSQVFRGDARGSLFCEFDAVLAPEFWPALRAMAGWHGDRQVELLVLEPGCDDFYFPEYGMYPAVSLSAEADVDDYWAAIGYEPDDEVLGSIAISAKVIAVTGPSGRWGCWGERDAEIAVFQGFPNMPTRNEWRTQFGPFLEVSGALETYLPLAFAGRTVPGEYAAILATNYGPGTDPPS